MSRVSVAARECASILQRAAKRRAVAQAMRLDAEKHLDALS